MLAENIKTHIYFDFFKFYDWDRRPQPEEVLNFRAVWIWINIRLSEYFRYLILFDLFKGNHEFESIRIPVSRDT